jgi:23S rRNA (cytidine1920-2'-O)/16S rRNA (cytidine1409-2'-O)-methyltransferase
MYQNTNTMKKIRLDNFLVDSGMAPNLKIAQSIIMQGLVHNSNKILAKPGLLINNDHEIFIKRGKGHHFVSRGGLKLNGAIKQLDISVQGKICVDIGCSTGGFTEVLLAAGAKHIFAVDVAYGEFDYSLRQNEKITLYERTNARHLSEEMIYYCPELVVCDASFISLKEVLLKIMEISKSGTEFLALIKPQFEVLRELAPKGIVKDPKVWSDVCQDIACWFERHNYIVKNIVPSDILGAKGNKEFFIHSIKGE